MESAEKPSLYDRLGGVYSIATVVDDFIDRVMADSRLNANPLVDEAHHRVPPAGFKYLVVYARLHAPGGDGTIALHQAGPGVSVSSDGVRLYLEVCDLDNFCRKLQKKGFYITQLPRMMPWGWRHAYLNDPDGHEISLYWAGENRMKKTVMEAARRAART